MFYIPSAKPLCLITAVEIEMAIDWSYFKSPRKHGISLPLSSLLLKYYRLVSPVLQQHESPREHGVSLRQFETQHKQVWWGAASEGPSLGGQRVGEVPRLRSACSEALIVDPQQQQWLQFRHISKQHRSRNEAGAWQKDQSEIIYFSKSISVLF